jgi:type II secretory pathway pseudopilin PulG
MKQAAPRNLSAFTIIEMLVIIAVLMVLASMYLPYSTRRATAKAPRISCMNNLKEIGMAYRLWAGDNGDLVPPQQTVKEGGWADLLTNADQGAICWTNYAIMATDLVNDLGQSPKLVICPADERTAAISFTNGFDNTHLSYFVGVSANDIFPQSIQGGDRNLGSGPDAFRGYGFSPDGGKGNDVAIQTNSLLKPVSWSARMHSGGYAGGYGNIVLADGSSQQTTSASFRADWLSHADPTTNWPAGHVPASPSIRLIFP